MIKWQLCIADVTWTHCKSDDKAPMYFVTKRKALSVAEKLYDLTKDEIKTLKETKELKKEYPYKEKEYHTKNKTLEFKLVNVLDIAPEEITTEETVIHSDPIDDGNPANNRGLLPLPENALASDEYYDDDPYFRHMGGGCCCG